MFLAPPGARHRTITVADFSFDAGRTTFLPEDFRLMEVATLMALTDEQLAEVEKLVDQNGFLPLTPKALRLFDEAERLLPSESAEGAEIAKLRSLLNEGGYLPHSRAKALLSQVRSLRSGKAALAR